MKKYHVAVEAYQPSAFAAFSPLGFGIKYYTATLEDNQPVNAETLYNLINENQERKPKTMLQWCRNTYGHVLVHLWALNDEGNGCYEYATATGTTKLSALWHLFKRLRRQGQAHLLRYVKKQEYEGNGLEDYKKIHFKIKRVDDNYYIIRQRHTLLFFFHFYDDGAEILCPYYRAEKEYQAQDRIDKTAREKGFDYCIHTQR